MDYNEFLSSDKFKKYTDKLTDIVINPNIIDIINNHIYELFNKSYNGMNIYKTRGDRIVFDLKGIDNYIFKISNEHKTMKNRFKRTAYCDYICDVYNFNLLIIPRMYFFKINCNSDVFEVIIEEKIQVNTNPNVQEYYFDLYSADINEAIKQLALFICKTKFEDVDWRNIPLINVNKDKLNNIKIALIDLEDFGSVENGIFGKYGSRGLMKCVNIEQCKIIYDIISKNNISLKKYDIILEERMMEINNHNHIKNFYLQNNITKGYEKIHIKDIDKFIDIFREYLHIKYPNYIINLELDKIIINIVEYLNNHINDHINDYNDTFIRHKRQIYVDANRGTMLEYNLILLDEESYSDNTSILYMILLFMKKMRYIYSVHKYGSYVYIVQA